MDRKPLREFTHKAENFLSVSNDTYKQWIFRYTFLEMEKDLGLKGDVTSRTVFKESRQVKAKIVARENGVFAGGEELKYFLIEADKRFRPNVVGDFLMDFKFKDGDVFEAGAVLLEIDGDVFDLLVCERTILNLLMRMSGVATNTRKIIDNVKDFDVLITPTRKTLWGLLDKKAVIIGGGGTHRLSLSDAILVKDTHLDLIGRNFEQLFENLAESGFIGRFVEIEVSDVKEAVKVAMLFSEFLGKRIRSIGVVLMDNMEPRDILQAITHIKDLGLCDCCLFEASGGINESNIRDYAQSGVDIISMGALTSGVKPIDMSLKML